MSKSNTSRVVKKQHLLFLALSGLLWAPLAHAQDPLFQDRSGSWRLLHPEIGLGGGGLNVGAANGGVLQADLIIGAERDHSVAALGGLLKMDLSFFDNQDPANSAKVYRYDMSLLATASTRGENAKLFARVGAGPMMTWAWVNGRESVTGIGGQVEVAAGWKSITELYVDTRVSHDAFGPSFGLSAGARVHIAVLLAMMGSG